MNARAIARHYAMLAGDGILDGTRLLTTERCQVIQALQTDAPDTMFGARTRWALGYMLGGDPERGGHYAMGQGGSAFGHDGNGGSLGYADPVRKLGFGLTKNRMHRPELSKTAAYAVTEAIRAYLDHRSL